MQMFKRLYLQLFFTLAVFAPIQTSSIVNAQEMVDLELVLAVDISRSMDFGEQVMQRQGYVEAFRSAEVLDAITGGGFGRIAVTYLEWAGVGTTRHLIPWTLIDGRESAEAFAEAMNSQSPIRLSRTSISNGLSVASTLLKESPWQGLRRVIDISGDGPNNNGLPVTQIRDSILSSGVVINGLPLMVRTSTFGFGIDNLDEYYYDCVIGGTGSFVLPAYSWQEFPRAVRRKLVLEIAGWQDQALPSAVSFDPEALDDPTRPRTDCLIGEKLWEQRMRDLEWR
jgi:hypothetical protein